jgi:hypothetical protein
MGVLLDGRTDTMTWGGGMGRGKRHLVARWWIVAVAAASVLVGGAWVVPALVGSGPALGPGSEQPAAAELTIPASETAKDSPPLSLETRIPLEALNAAERAAAGVIPSAVGVIDKTAGVLPMDEEGLGFGELRVLLQSGEVARFSWQRWDADWDFERFAGIDPGARRVDLGGGRVALYQDPGGSRRSVIVWTGDLLVTVTIRSAVDGTAPATGPDEITGWATEFVARLAEAGF